MTLAPTSSNSAVVAPTSTASFIDLSIRLTTLPAARSPTSSSGVSIDIASPVLHLNLTTVPRSEREETRISASQCRTSLTYNVPPIGTWRNLSDFRTYQALVGDHGQRRDGTFVLLEFH
jgi:hypothetical protein